MAFKEISPEEIKDNPFKLIGKDWMLITAEYAGKVNMMTASWGGIGVMWNKPVAYIAVRPQRFTKTLIDATDTVSLCFFNEKYRKELAYAGKASGKNEDKVAHCGFTVDHSNKTPYFDEARLVLIGKKAFAQNYKQESFIDPSIMDCYEKKDFHTLYILEIEKVLVKE
ncbi:MAG: hypothetical protein M0P13_01450 [Fibrobacteraceae bacterium]|nr:hypothetical protein [Fibrobacteraceae bacterium]